MRQIFLTLILALGMATSLLGSDTLYFDPTYEYTQEDVDSIIQNELILESNYEIFGQILQSRNLKGWEWFYLYKGKFQKDDERNNEGAIESYGKAISILEENDGDVAMLNKCRIDANLGLGGALQGLRLYDEAILIFQKALDLAKNQDYPKRGFIKAGIGACHYMLGNDSLAYALISEVSKDSLYMENPRGATSVWNALATFNQASGDMNVVKDYIKKALAVAEEKDFHVYDRSLNQNLATIYWNEDSMQLVKHYLEHTIISYERYEQQGTPYKAAFRNKAVGTLKILDGNITEGIQIIQGVIDTITNRGIVNHSDKTLVATCYNRLLYAFKQLKRYDDAFEITQKRLALEKWYSDYRLKQQLQKLEIEYQAKEKDLSISSLTSENSEQLEIILKQKTYVAGSGILAGLLGLIGFLVYRQRGLKAKYKEANLKQRLLRTQMDPHFVYNSLNSVSSLVYQKSDMAIPFISKLASLLRLVLENSRQELVPLEDEIAALDSYLSLESNFGRYLKFTIDTYDMETDLFLAPPMLIQPFVENSIKHGFKGIEDPEIVISIAVNPSTNLLEVSIIDNGVGLTQSQKNRKHQSVSTSIVKERLAIFGEQYDVDAKLVIEELPNQSGTRVFMTIPYLRNPE